MFTSPTPDMSKTSTSPTAIRVHQMRVVLLPTREKKRKEKNRTNTESQARCPKMHNEGLHPIPILASKPPSTLQLYDALESTAISFVNSIISRRSSHHPDYKRLCELAVPHFRISFAPRSFADQSPTLQESYDIGGFCELIQRTLSHAS